MQNIAGSLTSRVALGKQNGPTCDRWCSCLSLSYNLPGPSLFASVFRFARGRRIPLAAWSPQTEFATSKLAAHQVAAAAAAKTVAIVCRSKVASTGREVELCSSGGGDETQLAYCELTLDFVPLTLVSTDKPLLLISPFNAHFYKRASQPAHRYRQQVKPKGSNLPKRTAQCAILFFELSAAKAALRCQPAIERKPRFSLDARDDDVSE